MYETNGHTFPTDANGWGSISGKEQIFWLLIFKVSGEELPLEDV